MRPVAFALCGTTTRCYTSAHERGGIRAPDHDREDPRTAPSRGEARARNRDRHPHGPVPDPGFHRDDGVARVRGARDRQGPRRARRLVLRPHLARVQGRVDRRPHLPADDRLALRRQVLEERKRRLPPDPLRALRRAGQDAHRLRLAHADVRRARHAGHRRRRHGRRRVHGRRAVLPHRAEDDEDRAHREALAQRQREGRRARSSAADHGEGRRRLLPRVRRPWRQDPDPFPSARRSPTWGPRPARRRRSSRPTT